MSFGMFALVLLVIVLIIAPFISQGLILPVDLPKAEQSQQASSNGQVLEITINAQNQIFFEGNLVTEADLGGALDAHLNTTPVQLRVDKAAAFKHIIGIVDVLKAKQFERLSIQTEQIP